MYSVITVSSSHTFDQLSRLILLKVISQNHRSTLFNQEECVGMKCSTKQPFLVSSYSLTFFYAQNNYRQQYVVLILWDIVDYFFLERNIFKKIK